MSRDGPVSSVADALRLGFSCALNEGEELTGKNWIMYAVVDPPFAQHAVLGSADKSVVGPVKRRATVAERHEIGVRMITGAVVDHHELDADFPLRVVETEAAGFHGMSLLLSA